MDSRQSSWSRMYNYLSPTRSEYFRFYSSCKSNFRLGKDHFREMSFQLSNFKKNKKFYMYSYLIFFVTYYHVFMGLNFGKLVNCKTDPVKMWYPTLWKQKTTYNFYEFDNSFVSSFKKLIFWLKTSRLCLEATTFLDKKERIESMEHYNVIIIYSSREKPLYLLYYVSKKMFVVEVCKQYNVLAHFFHEKKRSNPFLCLGELEKFYWEVFQIFMSF
jgi:hypothetical protein